MFFVRFDGRLYAYVFIGVLLMSHGFAIYDEPNAVRILAAFATFGSFVLCMRMCKDEGYGYLEGLEKIGRQNSGFSIQLTALVLVPVFFVVHLICTALSLIGIFAGREFTVRAWSKLSGRYRPLRGQKSADFGEEQRRAA